MADLGSTANLSAGAKIEAAAGTGGAAAPETSELRKNFNYALVKVCDMSEDMRSEAVDTVVSAVEKHATNYEAAAKLIKETMDKRCGTTWHAIVGEGYGFEVTHEVKSLLYMFFGGSLGILLFKTT